jgi:hypothetical protein
MPKTIDIPGRFRYRADALPNGHRNIRRVFLHAPVLYEVAAVEGAEIRRGAVRVRTYEGEEVSYALYDGRLWRPANPANPVSLEDYRRMTQTWAGQEFEGTVRFGQTVEPRKRAYHTDPISHSHDFRDDFQWPNRGGMSLYAEEDFKGKLVVTDRDSARIRHQAASRHVLLVDEEIHFAAPEPLWDASYDGPVRLVAPEVGIDYYDNYALGDGIRKIQGWRTFAPERCDDALAFAHEIDPARPHPVEGEVLSLDPEYVAPPVMSRAVQDCFYGLFRNTYEFLRYLSPTSFAALGALQGAAISLSSHGLGALDRDPSALVEGLRSIRNDVECTLMPETKEREREYLMNALVPVLQRADFEAARKPRLSEEDDLSISAVALTR